MVCIYHIRKTINHKFYENQIYQRNFMNLKHFNRNHGFVLTPKVTILLCCVVPFSKSIHTKIHTIPTMYGNICRFIQKQF